VISVAEVAREAGVAYSTASLALRGLPRVAEGTRKRVLEAAKRLGYQPNAAASVLAGQRHRRVRHDQMRLALLGGGGFPRGEDQLARGVQTACEELGYDLEVVVEAAKVPPRELGRTLYARGVTGLIFVANAVWGDYRFDELGLAQFSCVKITRAVPSLTVSTICSSATQMMRLGLDEIFRKGYRSVHCIYFRSPSEIDNDARLGTILAYRQRRLPRGGRLIATEQDPSIPGEKFRDRIVSRSLRWGADAVFAFPISLCWAYHDRGISIPSELGFAGGPWMKETFMKGLSIARVSPCRDAQGGHAVHRLHELILRGRRGLSSNYDETVIPPIWIDGDSLPDRS